MADRSYLVLQDGSIFKGTSFGAHIPAFGEVVFNTSMTGYQEMLTDPSYAGQIVVPTYPMMGNYGINVHNSESRKVQVSGFVVRQYCEEPSHYESTSSLKDFLQSQGVTGISEVDTRAVTRRIRKYGVMMGAISVGISAEEALRRLKDIPGYEEIDYVKKVSASERYDWSEPVRGKLPESPQLKILVSDFGLKFNILRILTSKGCNVEVFPSNSSAEELLGKTPDGIMLSPGPGDPNLLDYAVSMTKNLLGRVPVMGICLGNQVLGRALGGKTYKLKFGHRGANHPVRDELTGRIHITAQNHGYTLDPESLPSEVQISHVSMNDQTVEGIRHRAIPAMSIQYHSEASPGPSDNEYIFDRFLDMVRDTK